MANPLNISLKVVGLDQAKADLAQFATIGKRSFEQIANEARNFAQSAAATDPALRGVANRVRQLAAASDEAFASNLKLRGSISDVERAFKAEMISAESAAKMTANLRAEHEKLANSTRAVVAEIKQIETIGSKSYGTITAMAQRAATAIQPTAQSTHDLAVAMKELSLAADPAAAAQMRLLSGLTQVKSALDQKIISTQQAIKLEQYLREQSQATARAEAELENKTRSAAAARAQASIQAANAQKLASQMTIAAMQLEMQKMEELRNKSVHEVVRGAPSGGAPAPGSQGEAELATKMRDLSGQANPMGAANLALQRSITEVRRARQLNLVDDTQEMQNIAQLEAAHRKYVDTLNRQTAAHKTSTSSMNTATQSASKLTSGMTQLSFQVNDIATSLASGASPFMVIAQQGGQIFQVFQTFPGLLTKVALLLTNPFVLAGIAITAVAASFAYLISRIEASEARLRTYDVALKAIGGTSEATAQDLEDVAKGLQHTGTSAEDAQKAVLAFARTPLINKGAAEEITNLGRDIAAATGQDFVQVTQDIAKAIATDTEAVIKLVQSLSGPNGLSVATASAMRELARIGDRSGAAQLGIKNLREQFGGSFNNTLSDGQKSINNIATAWDNMLTKLQNTTVVKAARDAVIGMLNGIANAVSTVQTPQEAAAAVTAANNARAALGNPYAKPLTTEQLRDIKSGTTGVGGVLAPNTMSPQDLNILVGVDPRAIGIFNEAKIITGELGTQVTSHGGTQGGHAPGSQHYPWNTSTGMGEAIDYAFTEQPAGGKRLPYNYAPPGSDLAERYARFNQTAAQIARDRYGVIAAQGQNFNPYDPGHIGFPGMPPLAGAGGPQPLGVGGALAPRVAPVAAAPLVAPGLTQDQLNILKEGVRVQDLQTAAVNAFGTANREAQIWLQAYTASVGTAADDEMTRTKGMQDANAAIVRHRLELQQTATSEQMTADLALKTASAFGKGEVEGYKAAAEAQAILAGRQGQLADSGLILQAQASEAILSGAKAIPGLKQQADATTRLAEAAKGGAGAEHAMGVENQISAATHDALKKAEASGNQETINRAKLLREVTGAQIKRNDAEQQSLAIQQRMNQRKEQIAVVTQQTALVGQLPETIEAANARLVEQQKLLAAGKTASDAIWQSSMANVEALNKANIAYAEAQRQQQRIDSMYQQIGSTIESAIGNVIEGIFDPKKAMDWGKAVKDMAKQLFTGIATNFFTKPLIGDMLSIIGAAPTVTSQFGSLFGTGTTTTTAGGTTATSGSGMLSTLGSLGNAAGLFKTLGLGDTFKSITNFFDEGLGGAFAHAGPSGSLFLPGSDVATPLATTMPGSIFGSTTLGGAALGVGAGFAGGTILNSLIGGNKTGGMIGSGVGSLAGLALTPFLGPFGPILGGLAGGALGGMFGNSKPSNQAAGGNIDLSQFKFTSGFAGGNQQIDQQMAQMGNSLQGFLDLLKTTGGSLSGNVLLQQGVNTGITVDSSLPGYAGRFSLGKDSEAALKVIEQALIKSITGVSDTMKTVLSQVGTDEDIGKAIQFAQAYDTLSDAADDAFSSVEDSSKQMGPFRIAMDNINALFADLTASATRFGLSLEPLNAGLAEATSRLQDDFTNAIEEGINAASGEEFINSLSQTIDDYLASTVEAAAVGLTDQATGDLLGTLFMDQINAILKDLDVDELTKVVMEFGAQADAQSQVVADLAQTMLNTTRAADDLANALEDRLLAALENIKNYVDSLVATESFGVSPEDALTQSQAQYTSQVALAQGGDIGALEDLTNTADEFLKAVEGFYGSSEAGKALFDQVVSDLQGLAGTDEVHEAIDPVVTAVTDLTSTVAPLDPLTQTQTAAITDQASALIANNNEAAATAIAANNAAIDTLTQVSTDTATANIENNNEQTAAAIAAAQADTDKLLDDAELQKAALVAANDLSAANTIAANDAVAAAAIADAKLQTAALQATNDANAAKLVAQSDLTTQQLIDQAGLDSTAALAESQKATTDLITQSDAVSAANLTATETATGLLTAQADAASQAALAESQAATTSIVGQAETDKQEQLAANAAATDLLKAGQDAATTALLSSDGLTREAIIGIGSVSSVVEAIGVWGEDLHNEIFNGAKLAADVANAWGHDLHVEIHDGAVLISNAIAIWGADLHEEIFNGAKLTSDVTGTWGGTIVTSVSDAANSVIAAVALWGGTQVETMKEFMNNQALNSTDTQNSIVTAVIDGSNNIISTIANWVGTHINTEKDLLNSIINTNLTYSNAQVAASLEAANSIISTNKTYSNNTIARIDTFASSNYNWLQSINTWASGSYQVAVDHYNKSVEMRQDILNKLQDMVNLLRGMQNLPAIYGGPV